MEAHVTVYCGVVVRSWRDPVDRDEPRGGTGRSHRVLVIGDEMLCDDLPWCCVQ